MTIRSLYQMRARGEMFGAYGGVEEHVFLEFRSFFASFEALTLT